MVIAPPPVDCEQLVRHLGLIARDLYELTGDTGPHQITGQRTTMTWDPSDGGAALFYLEDVELRVPNAALDRVGLTPTATGNEVQS